jgi:5-methylcytosine-specific restriction endonuclease McrA
MKYSIEDFHRGLDNKCKRHGEKKSHFTLSFAGVDQRFRVQLGLSTFHAHGTDCSCGAKGSHFEMVKSYHNGKLGTPQLRLIAYKNGVKTHMTCDHIIPKTRGGARYQIDNVQPLCYECNQAKGNMLPSEQLFGRDFIKKWQKNPEYLALNALSL